MGKKMPKSKFLPTLTVLSMILFISGIYSAEIPRENPIDQEVGQNLMRSPIVAGDHAPISIDGNSELATFIATEGLRGQGTFALPYIIENYTIDASSEHGIEIRNTDNYLVIQNCTVSAGNVTFYGIYFSNVSNTNVMNNILQENYFGIYLSSSSNNTLSGNNVRNNTWTGIFLGSSSDNNILSWNSVNNNWPGIVISSSNNNTLSGNNVNNNDIGISLLSSNNNFLSGNDASNTHYGIHLSFSSNNTLSENDASYATAMGIYLYFSSNNSLLWNNASNNTFGGIYLVSSGSNTLLWNNASFNTVYGISLSSSINNIIYFNIFLENINGSALCFNSSDNSWDNGSHGNYWGDYEVRYPSASNDGTIWDTPYQIDADNIDNYPLVDPPRQTNSTTDTDDDTDDNSSESGNFCMKYEPLIWIVAGIIIISTIYLFVKNNKKEKNRDIDTYEEF